ncbi:unnamed protein product [Amoebophrya sp. A120]|nr:unnamed protein product [Amoebophrya sp. A120]|eukprot:GSA120T00014030001.1
MSASSSSSSSSSTTQAPSTFVSPPLPTSSSNISNATSWDKSSPTNRKMMISIQKSRTTQEVLSGEKNVHQHSCAVSITLPTPSLFLKQSISVKTLKQRIAAALQEQKLHASVTGRPVQWEQVQIVTKNGGVGGDETETTLPDSHEIPLDGVDDTSTTSSSHQQTTILPNDLEFSIKTFEPFDSKRTLHKALMVVCSEYYHTKCDEELGTNFRFFYRGLGFDEELQNKTKASLDEERKREFDTQCFDVPSDFDPSDGTEPTEHIIAHVKEMTPAEEIHSRYGPLRIWDCSKIEDLSCLFVHFSGTADPGLREGRPEGLLSFNRDISGWDVSGCRDFEGMFGGCEDFDQELNSWDVSKAENLAGMFSGCRDFNHPLDKWNTENVKDMSDLFRDCDSFNQPLDTWNTGKVSTTERMFVNCKVFNQPLDMWNVENVTSVRHMFTNCDAFGQDLNAWSLSKVKGRDLGEKMRDMFAEITDPEDFEEALEVGEDNNNIAVITRGKGGGKGKGKLTSSCRPKSKRKAAKIVVREERIKSMRPEFLSSWPKRLQLYLPKKLQTLKSTSQGKMKNISRGRGKSSTPTRTSTASSRSSTSSSSSSSATRVSMKKAGPLVRKSSSKSKATMKMKMKANSAASPKMKKKTAALAMKMKTAGADRSSKMKKGK